MKDPLSPFLPPVREWFRKTLGEPTAAQKLGWPAIAARQNTLILAPTGSGKTLAAFLACLDGLWRQNPLPRGVQVLYISPLKALNNDIHRNLQSPLEGVANTAVEMGIALPRIEAGVRTGDTPTTERQRQLRKPPHVLITTPESLHLLLTSRGRDILHGVTHVIIDEIHALCGNKRGVFLALLLERLAALQHDQREFVRIGLSATQRPLEEVARYLGGFTEDADGKRVQRPVTLVDAGLRRDLDLRVVSPVEQFGPLPERTVWPSIYRLLVSEIKSHRSTIVFANNRRAVERITAFINETDAEPGSTPLARAHHGSVSLEERQTIESALKEGRLSAVVATASLEMGIDMGAVDLVLQVESPGNVARGLQRVGRAGHLVGQRSKGRLIPKTLADLLEQAVLAHEMTAGRVEEVRCPQNCLDVLAQQVIAMTASEPWEVPTLYGLVRRASPYRDLSPQAFETVLEMVSGRYRFTGDAKPSGGTLTALQPRVSWDRVHNRLHALPGSQQMALVGGGTIPDTGQYAVYTGAGVRIGELDEEFIYERRVGDTFLLGTTPWRLDRIDPDRVIVNPAEGAPAMAPFWRGEGVGRSRDLGLAIGRFLRELPSHLDDPECESWLQREYHLDANSARDLRKYARRQLDTANVLPSDTTLLIEASRDQLGDWQVLLLSPLGARLHLTLRLAMENRLRERLGYSPQCLHHDDGLLLRQTDTDEPLLDLFDGLVPETIEDRVLEELADSALFALRFRQNAARALLFPRQQPGKRSPLWLQRLRGKDLLQVARKHPDFPIVIETFRECLHDHLDVDALKELLAGVRSGAVQVVTRRAETPSPFASSLLFSFTAAFMYQYDDVESDRGAVPAIDQQLLSQLVSPDQHDHLLDPRAVTQVERRLRGVGQPPRSTAEMAEWLRRLGDLAASDLEGPMAAFLVELEADGRAVRLTLPGGEQPERWILAEDRGLYEEAFGLAGSPLTRCEGEGLRVRGETEAAAEHILTRFLTTHALVGLSDVLRRYPFEAAWVERKLEEWSSSGRLVVVPRGELEPLQWSAPENLEQVERGSLALLRREVTTCPATQLQDFALRWHGLHPAERRGSVEGLVEALSRLEGLAQPAELWERTLLPSRVPGYQPRWLDERIASGEWVWVCDSTDDNGPGSLAFFQRESLLNLTAPVVEGSSDAATDRVLDCLRRRGALFVADIAADIGVTPTRVRASLWTLLRKRLVTNDRYDVVRRGEPPSNAETTAVASRPRLRSMRSAFDLEGRWSLLPWGRPAPEEQLVFQASLLLNRYGVVARELALLDPWMPSWRVLYEVLSRMELAGDVRRGYFAEGLSGAQFALPEAARRLEECATPSTAAAPVVLLHSLDPANLYGSGAPLDIPLLDGGTRPFVRRAGNWLTLKAGRPVLIVEQQGRKLTALASASREEIATAAALLPGILDADRKLAGQHKLTVDEWNGQPVTTTEGRELLEAVGFVRDYQGMVLYAAWR